MNIGDLTGHLAFGLIALSFLVKDIFWLRLMSITAMAVNGLSPKQVSILSPEYANEMGIQSSLTPSRANGFLNMFRRVQEEAIKLL